VVEVKHWDRAYIRANRHVVEAEAEKLARKAPKLASKLRRLYPNLGYIAPKMLLTKEQKPMWREGDASTLGVRLYSLLDWRELLELDDLRRLPADSVDRLCSEIAPRSGAVLSGNLRRLGQITDLALLSPDRERFHRIYRGRNVITQDRLIAHVYDLSASDHDNPEHLARREFEVVQRLQKSPWLPGLVDSFQPVPNYPGELFFFSLSDSSAPSLGMRARDRDWELEDRILFTRRCLIGLEELHHPPTGEDGVIHRTITPDAVLVRPGGEPLFFHWEWAKIFQAQTIVTPDTAVPPSEFASPEVRENGLGVADRRSDIYALCATLITAFEGDERARARQAVQILTEGTRTKPEDRASTQDLAELIGELRMVSSDRQGAADEPEMQKRAWTEDAIITVDGHHYRVLSRLGAGGAGQTFKLQQFGLDSGEEFGTYVAKLVSNPSLGAAALRSFKLARPHTKHASLATIYSTSV
jgi:serine/threonine protein kinase